MKRFFIPLLLIIAVTGCGKKAHETKRGGHAEPIAPSQDGQSFKTLRDLENAIDNDDVTALERIVTANPEIDLNEIQLDGDTFFIRAIRKNSQLVRNFFIERGIEINKPNIDKDTALIVAVRLKFALAVRVLLENKVEINSANAIGDTALHVAMKNADDDLAYFLIREGAKIDVPNAQNKTALKLSEEVELPRTQELIKTISRMDHGAPDIASFRSILQNADVKTLTKVVSHYPKIISDYETLNPLAILVDSKDFNNAIRSAQYLLDNKANVNGPQNAETTPLIKATRSMKQGFVQLYLNAKANTQLLDVDGKSALIHAIEANDPELVDLLIANSAVENYTIRKNGKRLSFKACKLTYSLSSKYETQEGKDRNNKILEILGCNFIDRFI